MRAHLSVGPPVIHAILAATPGAEVGANPRASISDPTRASANPAITNALASAHSALAELR